MKAQKGLLTLDFWHRTLFFHHSAQTFIVNCLVIIAWYDCQCPLYKPLLPHPIFSCGTYLLLYIIDPLSLHLTLSFLACVSDSLRFLAVVDYFFTLSQQPHPPPTPTRYQTCFFIFSSTSNLVLKLVWFALKTTTLATLGTRQWNYLLVYSYSPAMQSRDGNHKQTKAGNSKPGSARARKRKSNKDFTITRSTL